jgi:SSS family solute:Na+ symporter
MTFSVNLPEKYAFLRNPMNNNMIIVIGTLTIFLTGLLLTARKRKLALELPTEERKVEPLKIVK